MEERENQICSYSNAFLLILICLYDFSFSKTALCEFYFLAKISRSLRQFTIHTINLFPHQMTLVSLYAFVQDRVHGQERVDVQVTKS